MTHCVTLRLEVTTMFTHVSRSHGTIWITVTAEEGDNEAATVTLRLPVQDAGHLSKQIEHEVHDWYIEHDPHEQAAALEEHHEERREIEVDLAFATEPF